MRKIVIVLTLGALAACSSSGKTGDSIADTLTKPIDASITAACRSDLTTVQTAQQAFYSSTGVYAASVQAIVDARFLQQDPSSARYTITTDASGTVYAQLAGREKADGVAGCRPS